MDEVQPHKALKSPSMPTLSELQEHRTSHLPYRAWCPECVEAWARERAQVASTTDARGVLLVSIDYFFLSDKGVATRDEGENKWDDPPEGSLRVLAGIDGSTKILIAHAVPQKGVHSGGYASRCLDDSIAWLGHS